MESISSSPADIRSSSPLRLLTQRSCEGRGEGVEGEGAREEKVGLRRGGGREGKGEGGESRLGRGGQRGECVMVYW